ncbi:HAD family phosphatase [Candidatus Sumerlaeota bacterium]|nr:HAD family phosphatase [Candidatus Sumerlaeota bacterium]
MITTLIFDLDGLLADTEKLHFQAYRDVFAELELELPECDYEEHWIRDGKGIAQYIEKRQLPFTVEEIFPKKTQHYEQLVKDHAEPMPGALNALRAFHGRKRLALATSSYRCSATAVLRALDIAHYFECIATKEDVERLKPFPDIFLHTARTLGAAPDECLVLEDAEKGILAAHNAGMRSIAIPNRHTQHNDFSKATLTLASLTELTPDLIETLE